MFFLFYKKDVYITKKKSPIHLLKVKYGIMH